MCDETDNIRAPTTQRTMKLLILVVTGALGGGAPSATPAETPIPVRATGTDEFSLRGRHEPRVDAGRAQRNLQADGLSAPAREQAGPSQPERDNRLCGRDLGTAGRLPTAQAADPRPLALQDLQPADPQTSCRSPEPASGIPGIRGQGKLRWRAVALQLEYTYRRGRDPAPQPLERAGQADRPRRLRRVRGRRTGEPQLRRLAEVRQERLRRQRVRHRSPNEGEGPQPGSPRSERCLGPP